MFCNINKFCLFNKIRHPTCVLDSVTSTFSPRLTILESDSNSVSKNMFLLYLTGVSSIKDSTLSMIENICRKKSGGMTMCRLDVITYTATCKLFVGSNPTCMNFRSVKSRTKLLQSKSSAGGVRETYLYDYLLIEAFSAIEPTIFVKLGITLR